MLGKNIFKVVTVGFDSRFVESSSFQEAVKAASNKVGEKVEVSVTNSHQLTCDAVLTVVSLSKSVPKGIPSKAVNIQGLLPNNAAKIIHDAICELHALVMLQRLAPRA